jgi:putative transcriptional regulator
MDLTNQFLIAMPALEDPNFSQTVTFVCAHNEEGAMGIVINRPMEIDLGEVFAQMEICADNPKINHRLVFLGGPVHRDRGFIIHNPALDWDSTIKVSPEIGVSTSRDILEAISNGTGPHDTLVALGYAGWGAGQLESEIAQNAWISVPATAEIIFRTAPKMRWASAAAEMGIDLSTMSHDIGHA